MAQEHEGARRAVAVNGELRRAVSLNMQRGGRDELDDQRRHTVSLVFRSGKRLNTMMPKRRRVSRPHVESKPPQRLVTKARKQELEEERRRTTPASPTASAPQAALFPQAAASPVSARRERAHESPDLLALLTGRKKPGPDDE